MKYIIILLIGSFSIISNAQNSENYFTNVDGRNIQIFENIKGEKYHKYNHIFDTDYALTGQYFWYHDKDGELIREMQSNITDAYLDGRHYSNLNGINMFGSKRLHEIKVQNENYALTQFYTHGTYFLYLIDKKSAKFVFKKEIVSKKSKKDRKLFEKKIKPYFKNCQEFIDLTYKSLETEYSLERNRPVDNMFKYVSNISCD